MSIECSECEMDARAGHDPSCSHYVVVDQIGEADRNDARTFAKADEQAYARASALWVEGKAFNVQLRTPEELERLKTEWLRDPCYDLASAEGFEAYRDQLAAFEAEQHRQWQRNAEIEERGYQRGKQDADPTYWLKQIATELKTLNANIEQLTNMVGMASGKF